MEGELIGELNFICNEDYEYSARCLNFSTIIKIPREKFIEIIKENQPDFEKFVMIKDQIIHHGYSVHFER